MCSTKSDGILFIYYYFGGGGEGDTFIKSWDIQRSLDFMIL